MHYLCMVPLLLATATGYTYRSNNLGHFLSFIDTTKTDLSSVDEKWIEQPLDHFDSKEKGTYKMRYFENLKFWKKSGPIFIYLEGEDSLNPIWISGHSDILIDQLANETNGALYASEHRYYGNSLPDLPNDNVIEYHKFLSSHQALEDIASLIKKIKSDDKYKSSKVVVIGGSYAGNLAAWMRELYPELVDAAVAASAPVLAKKDFKEYLDTVHYTFDKYGGEKCLKTVEKEFKEMEDLLKTKEGQEKLKHMLNICPNNDMSVLENQQILFSKFYDEFKDISQNGLPIDVKNFCEKLKSDHHNIMGSMRQQWCHDADYSSLINNSISSLPWAAWAHQSCTEFGYAQTTSSEKQPFVHWNPLKFVIMPCKYFVKGDVEKQLDEGIAKNNNKYGGLTPNVTKVVFTHGDMDPWHTLGVLKDLGPDAPSMMVNGTSHGAILSERPGEPDAMKEQRKVVRELIKKWIA